MYLVSVYHFGVFFCLQMFGFDKTTKKQIAVGVRTFWDQRGLRSR